MPNNDNGKWVTLDNGAHVFIKDGQSVEEALAERDKHDQEFVDSICKRVSYVQGEQYVKYADKDGNSIPPKKYYTNRLRKALEMRNETNDLVIKSLDKVDEFIIKYSDGSEIKRTYASGKGFITRFRLSASSNNADLLTHFMHESGHLIDSIGGSLSKWQSSTFVSPTHGATMIDMFQQEFTSVDLETIIDEWNALDDKRSKLIQDYKDGKIERQNYLHQYSGIDNAQMDLVDMSQAIYGDSITRKKFGYIPHRADYFNEKGNRGTELFAELTESKVADPNKHFYNLMKDYAPKTVEIYEEIMEELSNAER